MQLLTIILPIFLVIGLGYALRRLRFAREADHAWLSRFVFYVAAPCLLFHSTAAGTFDWGTGVVVLWVMAGVTVALAIVIYGAAWRVIPARRGVLVQGSVRSNTVFVGLPLVLGAYQDAALAPASVLIAFLVVIENLLAVLVLTLPHHERSARNVRIYGRTLLRMARNPLILGCAGGLLYSLLGIPLPQGVDRALALVGRTAAPLGLLCVGAGLDFGTLRLEFPGTTVAAGVKLLLYPAVVLLVLRGLGVEGVALGVPVLIAACPTAVVSYIMAREMDGDARFGAAIVIGTTAASLVTILGWLAILGIG